MSKEIELTQKLKELCVARNLTKTNNWKERPWSIESCLSWLREKGYKYQRDWLETDQIEIIITNTIYAISYSIVVNPEDELEGLLMHMLKIAEGGK